MHSEDSRVEQAFKACDMNCFKTPASATEVPLDHSPQRHKTESAYFVPANVVQRQSQSQVEKSARLLSDSLLIWRSRQIQLSN
jgi:hypothetical protein